VVSFWACIAEVLLGVGVSHCHCHCHVVLHFPTPSPLLLLLFTLAFLFFASPISTDDVVHLHVLMSEHLQLLCVVEVLEQVLGILWWCAVIVVDG
jgi:hypothetical protein